MNKDTKKASKKKPYEKPRLRTVNIKKGVQTLGIGCKLADDAGDPAMASPFCGITNGCVTMGS
ncbi:MAG: hypothetical protein ABII93_06160 [Chrysiogenia bacterium]